MSYSEHFRKKVLAKLEEGIFHSSRCDTIRN